MILATVWPIGHLDETSPRRRSRFRKPNAVSGREQQEAAGAAVGGAPRAGLREEDPVAIPKMTAIYRRAALLDVDEHLVLRFTDEVCQRIATTLSYVAERNGEKTLFTLGHGPRFPRPTVTGANANRAAGQRTSEQPSPPGIRPC